MILRNLTFGMLIAHFLSGIIGSVHAQSIIYDATPESSGALAASGGYNCLQPLTLGGSDETYRIQQIVVGVRWDSVPPPAPNEILIRFFTGANLDPTAPNALANATLVGSYTQTLSTPATAGVYQYTLTPSTLITVPSNQIALSVHFFDGIIGEPGSPPSNTHPHFRTGGTPVIGRNPGFVYIDVDRNGIFSGSEQTRLGVATANYYLRLRTVSSTPIPTPTATPPPVTTPTPPSGGFSFSTVSLSDRSAPGTVAGTNFFSFSLPTLNSVGQTAFYGVLAGPGVTIANDNGLWLGAPGAVALLAREGDPAPGTATGVNYLSFGSSNSLPINAGGQSVFSAAVTGPGITTDNDSGIWLGTPGSMAPLVREGDGAPGTGSGISFAGLSVPALNATGRFAFFAGLRGTGVSNTNNVGLWSDGPGSIMLLARAGDSAPGTEPGVMFDTFFSAATLNSAGQSTFWARVIGPGVTSVNTQGLWSGTPGSLALLARAGHPAPGTPLGVNYAGFSIMVPLNAAGQSTFSGNLTGTGVTGANDDGLWFGTPGNVALLARSDDPAPGAAVGVNYRGINLELALNASGQSAFTGLLTGVGITDANDSGLWVGSPGSLTKVVFEGETAPGAGVGTLFGSTNLNPFSLNNNGGVAFLNFLTGPDVTSANNGSLWFWDATGNLSLIVREGNPLEVAPGDTRIITILSFLGAFRDGSVPLGNDDAGLSGLNDLGQVAFHAFFTDGSQGIFVATPTGSPTPTATPSGTPSPTSSPTSTPSPNPSPSPSATPPGTPTPTPSIAPSVTPTASPTPAPGRLGNVSTRLRVETGENVVIGGFIVIGTEAKRVILRAIGPSLTGAGVPDAMANPMLELHGSSGLLASNDSWMDAPNRQEIIDTTIAPTNDFESAILMTLPASSSAYTAIVRGVNNSTGVGLVEAYDLDLAADSKLANISTRGFVQTGDNVMIGGFIAVGPASARVIVRAIGPSLPVAGALADPTLELRDGNGTLLQSNDNWRTGGQEAEIIATTIPPSDDLESAIVRTLEPGAFTAIVRDANNGTGVGLVEVYDLGPP